MLPNSAAVSPKTVPPSICATTESGLMGMPQSTTPVTLSTFTVPLASTLTSATWAA
ncbi:hypothetical protein D3C76_1471200 [compost metagenome]